MEGYTLATYGDTIAETYDRWFPKAEASMIAALAELSGSGPVLELGIGTGRVALPLLELGLEISGVDASQEMVDRLYSKPGGTRIPVTLGDFAAFELEQRFSLIYVVFNTFFGLLTQEDQVQCFQCVARHLAPGGRFVLELFVPDLSRFQRGQNMEVVRVEDGEVQYTASRHDPVGQRLTSQHVTVTEAGNRLYPVCIRYAWPSEVDLMARLAGLRLAERWAGWNREPFTAAARRHVSIYERDGEA